VQVVDEVGVVDDAGEVDVAEADEDLRGVG